MFNYSIWRTFVKSAPFHNALQQEMEFKGYKLRVFLVFLATAVFFLVRDLWGLGTEQATALFAQGFMDQYVTARYVSALGATLIGMLYFAFHYYIVTYFLYLLTELPYKWIQRVQVYVICILLVEKLIHFIVFYNVGYATNLSFLSLAPILAQWTTNEFTLFLLNQLTVGVVAIIAVQYTFLKKWNEHNNAPLLFKIIFVHIIIAIFVAIVSVLPLQDWLVGGL
ncbi:MAG: hypothetical protein UHX00_11605 [Caryophanon sp.]|nr:hypothetical protein [Caryophanon sp.]